MSFSFNWAGLSIPQMQKADTTQQFLDTASKLGSAGRGFVVDLANKEYADLIEGRNKSAARVEEIKQEIARLEQRNAFIDQQLAYAGRDFAPNAGKSVAPNDIPMGGTGWDVNASRAEGYYE